MADDDQQLNYKVNVDRSDVYQAINDIEQRAQQSAQSVSAMSSNILGQIAQMQASAQYAPQVNSSPMMNMNAMQSAMYAGSTMPFSPQNMMAQDAYQQQMMAMGPSSGYGPSMTTPFGTPTINPFQGAGAPSYQLPSGQLQQFGSPGQPNDPTRSRLFFGTGSGSAFNALRQSLPGLVSGRYGYSNDNLEDLMSRNVERQHQYMAENIFNVGSGVASFGGSLGMGAMGDIATQFGATRMLGMGKGFMQGAVGMGGGLGASMLFDAGNAYLEHRERAYQEGAKDLRDYTSPYIRGSRPGGGSTYKETLGMERNLSQQVGRDNFFNADDYKTLINMAGETGMFQSTGSTDQAMKAIDNMSKSVKTLYALGVKSREHLQAIDTAFNQFGVSAGADPTKLANLFQTFAATAQSAGMSTGQMVQTVAPAAQAAMAQGLGPMAGALMAAQNQGIAGSLFRSGALGGFDQAYFGGAQGFGQSLTQGQLAMARSPMGQVMTAGLFAPGSHTMASLMAGKPVGPMDAMSSMSGYAANPLGYIGMQARMPELTQELGPQLQIANIQMGIAAYKQMGLKTDEKGRIAPNDFLGFLISVYGMPENEALAMVKMLNNAQGAASDMRRSARDQTFNLQMEGLRKPSLSRRLEKGIEHVVDPLAVAMATGGREAALGLEDTGARLLGKAFGQDVKDYQELVTGVRNYDLGNSADLMDAGKVVNQSLKDQAFFKNLGYAQETSDPTRKQRASMALDQGVTTAMGSSSFRASVIGGLHTAGIDVNDTNVLALLQRAGGSTREVEDVSNASDLFRKMRSAATDHVSDPETRKAIDRVVLQKYRETQRAEQGLIQGSANFDPTSERGKALAGLTYANKDAEKTYMTGISDTMNATDMRKAFFQNVANADKDTYGGRSVDDISKDSALSVKLGLEGTAALEGLAQRHAYTSGVDPVFNQVQALQKSIRGINGGHLAGGTAASIEELDKRLQSKQQSTAGGVVAGLATLGTYGLSGAGLGSLAGAGIGAAMGLGGLSIPLGVSGALLGGVVGGAVGLGVGAYEATFSQAAGDRNDPFNHILNKGGLKAGKGLRIGSETALNTLAQAGVNSRDDLKKKLLKAGFIAEDAEDFLQSANIGASATGDEIRKVLGDRQKRTTLQLSDSDEDKDIAAMMAEISTDSAGSAGKYAYNARQGYVETEAFKASKTGMLDDKQATRVRGLFDKADVGDTVVSQLNSGSLKDFQAAVTSLAGTEAGKNADFKAVQKLLSRGSLGGSSTGYTSDIEAAGIDAKDYEGSNDDQRLKLLNTAVNRSTGGEASTEQLDKYKGGSRVLDKEELAAMQRSITSQNALAERYDKLAEAFSKDGTDAIVAAVKGLTTVTGGADGTGNTFKLAVDDFKKAVGIFGKVTPDLTKGSKPASDNALVSKNIPS